MRSSIAVAVILAACAGTSSTDRVGSGNPASQARERTSTASVTSESGGRSRPIAYTCGDTVLNDQSTSGGERLAARVPCWDVEEEESLAVRRPLAETRPKRIDRIDDPETALASADLVQCRGIPERELAHSPLHHRRAIAEVVPHRRGGKLRGVRVIMKPVPGLTAAWMERAIACHRARYEVLGKPATYMPDDPTLVDDAVVEVVDRGGTVHVLITSESEQQANLAVTRAKQIAAAERTAIR